MPIPGSEVLRVRDSERQDAGAHEARGAEVSTRGLQVDLKIIHRYVGTGECASVSSRANRMLLLYGAGGDGKPVLIGVVSDAVLAAHQTCLYCKFLRPCTA